MSRALGGWKSTEQFKAAQDIRRLRYNEYIQILMQHGHSKTEIAEMLEVARETLYRRLSGKVPIDAEALFAMKYLVERVFSGKVLIN